MTSYAVGSLVRTRGREWVVLPDSEDDLLVLRPLGGREDDVAGVLPELEPVEPAIFPPPSADDLGDATSARLLRSALRLGFRSSGGPFRSLAGIAVTPRPYQLVPLLMALRMATVRLLVADDVGIGKTIESALIAAELLAQGDARRLAVLCSPHLARQWQLELRDKFALDAEVVLPSTVTRLERGLGMNESLFERYPHVIVSTDFIKSTRRRDDFVRACPELVIVDEAHTCVDAAAGSGRARHQRFELLQRLAEDQDRHLILVTATPHSGKEEAFRNLLGLLAPALAALPEDLSGPGRERDRALLARHFVQRRRADIRAYLAEDTQFPDRHTREETYTLTPEYRRLFDRVLDYARETVTDPATNATSQRVRWWSALALLRSLASSPAAAAATLRSRAGPAEATSPEEADELGRASILDGLDEEATEAQDTTPGADEGDEAPDAARLRRRLHDLAREAEALAGRGDAKLASATRVLKRLLDDGYNPIVFCRFIPTAEYVADHLDRALGRDVEVAAVTGVLPPVEREQRIAELVDAAKRRVLVATDCLAEGINLQEQFSAVVHYDLAWNPTRHEQREGRVDRFGQPEPVVRAVTLYGVDNRIDGIVLEVLLRKHAAIRDSTGVSVPVPMDSNAVVEAVMEGVLLRRGEAPEQLVLEGVAQARRDELFEAWQSAADREKRSRTRYAQAGISPAEVASELAAVRAALGDEREVTRFTRDALSALGATVMPAADGFTATGTGSLPPSLRDTLPRDPRRGLRDPLAFHQQPPVPRGDALLVRTDPAVEAVAQYVLDSALDPMIPEALRPARRCGVLRTAAVQRRTTLLLVRFRFHLVTPTPHGERPVVAEEAWVLGFRGSPTDPQWLEDAEVVELLDATPGANTPPEQARQFVQRALDGLPAIAPALDAAADQLAEELLASHRRVREAAGVVRRGLRVAAQKPVDVLGVYVHLPLPEATA
jgi:superfamily II DNA or RNA helicase